MQNFMKHFKTRVTSAIIALSAILAIGCDDVNNDIGSNYLSDGQTTVMGSLDLQGYKSGSVSLDDRVMSTKLYRTDRIATSRQLTGLFGAQRDEVFGERRSGFFAQYTPEYSLDDEGFGYEPIVDSVVIYLSVLDYSGDTTVKHTYNVYEVLDDTFLTTSTDSVFNADYRLPSSALSSTPVFTFDYPDQENGYYVVSSYVRAKVQSAGVDLLNRLMLKEGEDGSQIDYTYYNTSYDYEDFVESFKGLYICPADDELAVATGDTGATYNIDLTASGFGFFGRNRYEEDPSIIADTLGMTFSFLDGDVYDVGGVSLTTVERDYSSSLIDTSTITTNEIDNDTHTSTIRVEGAGGVVTQLVLEPAMFEEFERVIEEADDEYSAIFFNVARLMLYVEESTEYDEPVVLSPTEADALSILPSRLGLYATFSTFLEDSETSEMETVTDYDYSLEYNYGTVSDFDGGFNRSLGCYIMNIPLHMQTIWNDYRDAKEEAGGDASLIDWDAQDWNKLIIGPIADDLLSPRYISLQGEADGVNKTPIRLDITYTLLK